MQKRKHAPLVILLLVLVLVAAGIGSVYAYLSAGSNDVNNTLQPETPVIPSVSQDGNVEISTQNYGVYVRATVVVTWKNDVGEVYAIMPKLGEDYTLEISDNWKAIDEYYYYNGVVPMNKSADLQFVASYDLEGTPPSGYSLNIEVITQTIQAAGSKDDDSNISAVYDAWGVTPEQILNS